MLLPPGWAMAVAAPAGSAAPPPGDALAMCAPRPWCWRPGMIALPAWLAVDAAGAGTPGCGVAAVPGLACDGWMAGGAACCEPASAPGALACADGLARWVRDAGQLGRTARWAGRGRLIGRRACAWLARGATACGTPGIAASADMSARPCPMAEGGLVAAPGPVSVPGETCPAGGSMPAPAVERLVPAV